MDRDMTGNRVQSDGFWKRMWKQYCRRTIGVAALVIVLLFAIVGLFAPFLASSRPLVVYYEGELYFPLFRYLFYTGFFTKPLDIFHNLLIFFLPIGLYFRTNIRVLSSLTVVFTALYLYLLSGAVSDPASDSVLNKHRQSAIQSNPESIYSWQFELDHMNQYAKLLEVIKYELLKRQDTRLQRYAERYADQERLEWLADEVKKGRRKLLKDGIALENLPAREVMEGEIHEKEKNNPALAARLALPTLWHVARKNDQIEIGRMHALIDKIKDSNPKQAEMARAKIQFIDDRNGWLEGEAKKLNMILPPIRSFHWEDDAGGEQDLNKFLDWWELTRTNRKDLVAGLLFGVRTSLFVGFSSMFLALLIGIPIGAISGYFAGRTDVVISRFLEVWESMPSFFMLLMVVAVTQSKSIFLVIAVIGIFGWTGISRFVRGEFFKQRNLPYVDACHSLGFGHGRIIFSHILPNAIPPLLTLMPFAMMGAITSEAGLSFLGLGEEGSCSWGVLMDEGRAAFPGESYLLWPPAIILTLLLVAIALVGDTLRDALDPKLKRG
jgi:peptide/nickel transport system permease protein